jgi:glycosyltransferase involved in cell wall biosynthesis
VRIALLSPLYESVPPQLYGGTERVVAWLADALVERGHEVVLFASGDSQTRAELIPVVDRALRLGGDDRVDPIAVHIAAAEMARRFADELELDVVHSHIDYLAMPTFRDADVPFVSTMHGRLDIPGLRHVHRALRCPLVSISDAQRAPLPEASWAATVYHGLPTEQYPVGEGDGDYVVFLGRMSPEKRPDAAIRAARRAGVRLVMAAKVDAVDRPYFEQEVVPLLCQGDDVWYIGEVDDQVKVELLGRARALLFPAFWPEPFGLAMIESMACGTPVIARRCGSIPEVVTDGHTGFVCDDDDALVEALGQLHGIDRLACRHEVEVRFSAERMAADYELVYEELCGHTQRAIAAVH